jgi:hypothetical protein
MFLYICRFLQTIVLTFRSLIWRIELIFTLNLPVNLNTNSVKVLNLFRIYQKTNQLVAMSLSAQPPPPGRLVKTQLGRGRQNEQVHMTHLSLTGDTEESSNLYHLEHMAVSGNLSRHLVNPHQNDQG